MSHPMEIVPSDPRESKWHGVDPAEISLPPGWSISDFFNCGGADDYLHLDGPDLPNVNDPTRMMPGGIGLEFPGRDSAIERALDVITALTISGLHEAIEWVKLDGERLAEPHLDDLSEFDWLIENVGKLVRGYREAFPVQS